MSDYGFEVFDADDDMKLFLDRKVAEFKGIDSNSSMQWLLQYF